MSQQVATPRFVSPLETAGHRSGLLRSIVSEFKKLNIRAITVTAIFQIAFLALMAFFFSNPEYVEGGNVGEIVSVWLFTAIFPAVIGVMAVTSEYSSNTMRTTAMADPNRPRAFLAKMIAVFIYTFLVNMATAFVAFGIAYARGSSAGLEFSGGDVTSALYYSLVLSIISLIGLGVGYIVRSTAGGITIMVLLLYFADLISMIPGDFFKETLPKYLLSALGSAAIMPQMIGASEQPTVSSQGMAFGILGLYVLVACSIGLFLYNKRDI